MDDYVECKLETNLVERLGNMPAMAILGLRQVGKSILAKRVLSGIENSIYLDLERPSDLNKLRDPEAFFSINRGSLVCLDEIQRSPDLFPVLRSIIDEEGRNGQLLILEQGQKKIAVEIKASSAPTVTKSFWNILAETEISEAWVIAPVKETYPLGKNTMVAPLDKFTHYLSNL